MLKAQDASLNSTSKNHSVRCYLSPVHFHFKWVHPSIISPTLYSMVSKRFSVASSNDLHACYCKVGENWKSDSDWQCSPPNHCVVHMWKPFPKASSYFPRTDTDLFSQSVQLHDSWEKAICSDDVSRTRLTECVPLVLVSVSVDELHGSQRSGLTGWYFSNMWPLCPFSHTRRTSAKWSWHYTVSDHIFNKFRGFHI